MVVLVIGCFLGQAVLAQHMTRSQQLSHLISWNFLITGVYPNVKQPTCKDSKLHNSLVVGTLNSCISALRKVVKTKELREN